jgi:hypothetical protein
MMKIYYYLKPSIPRFLQLFLRKIYIKSIMIYYKNSWPILPGSEKKPENWEGWPYEKKFALILTHDVEHLGGHDKVKKLMAVEKENGFVSSFNFVPKRYDVSPELREFIASNGFEVGLHGLYHDGKLYSSKEVFLERAQKINGYLKDWNVVGFRSPSMHHNLDWIRNLNIQYDASTFDVDPFEPQPDGVSTIYPFWVPPKNGLNGYVELPYTVPQDFTLFILMEEKSIEIWKRKLDWIVENEGMALINVHPDYIEFDLEYGGRETFPIKYYRDFLEYINQRYANLYWNPLPKELAEFSKKVFCS